MAVPGGCSSQGNKDVLVTAGLGVLVPVSPDVPAPLPTAPVSREIASGDRSHLKHEYARTKAHALACK